MATVPLSVTATYGAKQLLHFSSEQLNGGSIPVANVDAVQVVAFLGDVTDKGGPFTLGDAGLAVSVGDGDGITGTGEMPGDAPADAGTAASDGDDLHAVPLNTSILDSVKLNTRPTSTPIAWATNLLLRG